MMGRLGIAICAVFLVSGSAALAQDNGGTRARDARTDVSRISSQEAVNEGVTRLAVRVAFAPERELSRQESLSLLLLYAAAKRSETNLRQ